MALEADVLLLEAVLPSLCDAGVLGREPALQGQLGGLLSQLMALRFSDPLLITLVRRRSRGAMDCLWGVGLPACMHAYARI